MCLITIIWNISHKIHFEDEAVSTHYSSENFEKLLIDGSEVGGHFSSGTMGKGLLTNTQISREETIKLQIGT
jgi:hypothetical protein